MKKILDFFAGAHTPYLHARGRAGTRVLLEVLRLRAGETVLELGFGTGQTLVEVAAGTPGLALFGVESSPRMLQTARARLRFCGLNGVGLRLSSSGALPFPDGFFDAVYCESVLAIVPEDRLPGFFREIFRVLKPGGRFCCNESLWLETAPEETIRQINRQCREAFGIVQAPEQYGTPPKWRALGASAGFDLSHMVSLAPLPETRSRSFRRALLLSEIFSRLGWLKSLPDPRRRALRRMERSVQPYGRFLEGWLFAFRKPVA